MEKIENDLMKMFIEYRPLLPDAYKWEDEKDRWSELVFCVFSELSGLSTIKARTIVSALSDLQVIGLDDLAALLNDEGRVGVQNKNVEIISSILQKNGVEKQNVDTVLLTLSQLARGIKNNYGRMQLFLRKYGQLMLDELDESIKLTAVDKGVERYIYATWLQNILEFPLPLSNDSVQKFCMDENCSLEEVIDTADKLDINVAMLDDILDIHYKVRAQ
ncbi:MAG: hypothetical protein PHP43_05835 [Methanoculleus sp.]|nr:hypothetical protein [Methanoculleus sp.]